MKRPNEAEQFYREALGIRRTLAQTNVDAYLPDVATTLNNLANIHRAMRRSEEAEQSYTESLAILGNLASANPKLYLPKLAGTLHNQAMLYYQTERREAAQDMCRRARTILEPLWQESPELHGDGLARINILAAMLAGSDHPNEGRQFASEAFTAAYAPPLKRYAQTLIDRFSTVLPE